MACENSISPEANNHSPNLIIFTGPTASGKDTMMKLYLQSHPQFNRIVPFTTRKRHHNEHNGLDYWFITNQEFAKIRSRLCAVVERTIDEDKVYYGTPAESILAVLNGQPHLWKLDPETACNLEFAINDIFTPEQITTLLQQTAVVYLGVERLMVLKDRLNKRARPDDNRQLFLTRLQQEWECWQKLKDRFDPFVCDLNRNSETELLKMLEERLNRR